MHWTRTCIAAGLLAFTVGTADAAAPPRTMDLEILSNGQLLLRGEIIDGIDDLEAKLRIMREHEPPFELGIRLPKRIDLDAFAPFFKMLDDLRARFGFRFGPVGNPSASPKPSPIDSSI